MRFFPLIRSSESPVDGLLRLLGRAVVVGVAGAAVLSILAPASVRAADKPASQSAGAASQPSGTLAPPELTINVNSVGDAKVEYLVHLAPKEDNPELPVSEDVVVTRGLIPTIFKTQDGHRRRDHVEHTILVECKVPGLARPRPDGTWELTLPEVFDADFLHAGMSVDGGRVVLRADPAWGRLSDGPLECRVRLPDGCRGVALVAQPGRLAFQMPAPAPIAVGNQTPASVDFQLEARARLVSCLAKTYGYDRMGLWLGRSQIKNTGGQPMTSYRVRFRLPDYASDWSGWSRCATILPGQTVVDGYFPILDLDKIARVEGVRPAKLDTQYEYTRADGTVCTETDSSKLDILGHNDLPLDDIDVLPMVMASFATKDDPVIQRVAAMVSGQVPGGIDQSTRSGRLRFMRELYRFMLNNQFAYQIPPNDVGLQHVKFGRDVVLDRSGTCIDLAIFYNSVCEAVGIETRFYLKLTSEGHCLPAVFLPEVKVAKRDANGQLVKDKEGKVAFEVIEAEWKGVETTLIKHRDYSFDDALTLGCKEIEDGGQSLLTVNVLEQRLKGVHSLELPNLDENALKNAGITAAPPDLVGIWVNTVNNVNFETAFRSDGTMATTWTSADTGTVLYQGTGRYTYDGKLLTYSFPPASQEAEVVWTDVDHINYRTLKSTIPGAAGAETVMTRVK